MTNKKIEMNKLKTEKSVPFEDKDFLNELDWAKLENRINSRMNFKAQNLITRNQIDDYFEGEYEDKKQVSWINNVTNKPWVDVRRWGASTDAADNSTVLQAALDTAGSGGEVLIPAGRFNYATQLNVPDRTSLVGLGKYHSRLHYTGSGYGMLVGSGEEETGHRHVSLRDFYLTGTSSAIGGIQFRGISRFNIIRVKIHGFTNATYGYGLHFFNHCIAGQVGQCYIVENRVGIYASEDVDYPTWNAITIGEQTELQANAIAILLGDPTDTVKTTSVGVSSQIKNCTIEGNTTGGIHNVSCANLAIAENYFEQNVGYQIKFGIAGGNTLAQTSKIDFNSFNEGSKVGTSLDLVRCTEILVRENWFYQGDTMINVAATVSNVKILDNMTKPENYNHNILNSGSSVYIRNPYWYKAKARAYRNGEQSNLANGTTKIELNAESYDLGGNFDSTTNFDYTVRTEFGGKYRITAQIRLATGSFDASKRYVLQVKKGAAIILQAEAGEWAANAFYPTLRVADIVELAEADVITLNLYHTDTGDAVDIYGTDDSSTFMTIEYRGYD